MPQTNIHNSLNLSEFVYRHVKIMTSLRVTREHGIKAIHCQSWIPIIDYKQTNKNERVNKTERNVIN